MTDAYAELIRRAKEVSLLQSCAAVLGWDQQTYMPKAGARSAATNSRSLASLAHEKATDPRFGELLAAVEASKPEPDSVEAANVRELWHTYDRATKIPQRLVEELARVTTLAQQAWQEARAKNHFPTFRPLLEQVHGAEARGGPSGRLQGPPLRRAARRVRAGGHRRGGPAGLRRADEGTRPAHPQGRGLRQDADAPTCCTANTRPTASAGSPRPRPPRSASTSAPGRLDTTAHPFCSGFGPGDCRLTTRYNPRSFHEAFFGVLHEAGHGMYEQGLPAEHFGTPLRRRTARWASTSRSRDCGRTRSAAAGRSGTTSCRG